MHPRYVLRIFIEFYIFNTRHCANYKYGRKKLHRSFLSSLVPRFQYVQILPYENEYCMQFHFNANQSHFHKGKFS